MRPSTPEIPGLRAATGIQGLDDVLYGGFPANRLYLIQGNPGSGKTTLGLQFLMEGARKGESGFYVTLSETKNELIAVAASHSWCLDGITLYEVEAMSADRQQDAQYTVFPPDEVELTETIERVYGEVERAKPKRVVFDSLSEIRLMSRDSLRYRRQILALKEFFAGRDCTVLLLDDQTLKDPDLQIQSISHGVIQLTRLERDYGVPRRQLNVIKIRGSVFRDGLHDYVIRTGGIEVFPRLVAAEYRHSRESSPAESGLPELDELLGGGVHYGTSALILGPPGAGKSSLASQFAHSACSRGERVACFIFEESGQRFLSRSAACGRDLRPFLANETLALKPVDPTEMSPGEFTHHIKLSVEEHQTKLVIIDSLNGYVNAMPQEQYLLLHLHDLLSYLGEHRILTLLTLAQHGMISELESPVDLSYLTDTLILLRYFEAHGEVKQAISIVKNRDSNHERTIREFQLTPGGIKIGDPLTQFQGVLSGTPVFQGPRETLMQ